MWSSPLQYLQQMSRFGSCRFWKWRHNGEGYTKLYLQAGVWFTHTETTLLTLLRYCEELRNLKQSAVSDSGGKAVWGGSIARAEIEKVFASERLIENVKERYRCIKDNLWSPFSNARRNLMISREGIKLNCFFRRCVMRLWRIFLLVVLEVTSCTDLTVKALNFILNFLL